MRTFLSLLLALFLLEGCANYDSETYTADILPAENTAEQYNLNLAWWGVYGDKDLERLVALALKRNVDYAVAAITINRALYEAKILGAELVPTFSADIGETASRRLDGLTGENAGQDRVTHSYTSQLGVSYEIDLWQRLRNAATAQEWEYQATILDRETARLALVNSVVSGYFNLRYLNQAIELTEASVRRYSQLLDITKTRNELGKVDSVEPWQAEQSLLAEQNSLVSLQTERKQAEQTLRDLLNLRPGEDLQIGSADLLTTPTAEVNLDVPIAALAARPDIRASEARLQGAFKTVQASRGDWYPSITVGSSLSASSQRSSSLFDVPYLAGTISINLPFLQWNTLRWNLKISEEAFEQTKLELEQAVTTALNEVDAAYTAYGNTRRILEQTRAKHEIDVRIASYYEDRYRLGATELSDWLEALNTADESLLSALSAKYQLISWENQIYKAMGGRYEPK